MCHLILLLPVVALPLFWLAPPSLSIPVYAAVVVVSGWVYAYAIKAMRLPLQSEDERLRQDVGTVSAVEPRGQCRIEILGESWQASCPDSVQQGDLVKVTGRDGLTLRVDKIDRRKSQSP